MVKMDYESDIAVIATYRCETIKDPNQIADCNDRWSSFCRWHCKLCPDWNKIAKKFKACDNNGFVLNTITPMWPTGRRLWNYHWTYNLSEKRKNVSSKNHCHCTHISRSDTLHIDCGANSRVAKANVVFCRFHGNVWDRKGIGLDTELNVYKAVVLPTHLYACETRIMYPRHSRRLISVFFLITVLAFRCEKCENRIWIRILFLFKFYDINTYIWQTTNIHKCQGIG